MESSGSEHGSPTGSRRRRIFAAADANRVPLRTILTIWALCIATFIGYKLILHLHAILLVVVVSALLAAILNPFVGAVQRLQIKGWQPHRGQAVAVVFTFFLLVFAGVATAFGYPLVNAVVHFANRAPDLVKQAEHGKGWIGHLVQKFQIQSKVQQYAPKLATAAQNLAKPALSFGKATVTAVLGFVTIVMLTLFTLLELPRMGARMARTMSEERVAEGRRIAVAVSESVTRYVLGRVVMSLIAFIASFILLFFTHCPFVLLLALWVAIVDVLPIVGGFLQFVVITPVALSHSVSTGIVVGVVWLVYMQVENHILNPVIMSKAVKLSPLVVLLAVLTGASVGGVVGSLFGGLVGAFFAIPVAGAIQVVFRELWDQTAGPEPLSDLPMAPGSTGDPVPAGSGTPGVEGDGA